MLYDRGPINLAMTYAPTTKTTAVKITVINKVKYIYMFLIMIVCSSRVTTHLFGYKGNIKNAYINYILHIILGKQAFSVVRLV